MYERTARGMRKLGIAVGVLAALLGVMVARAEDRTAEWNALVDEFLEKVYSDEALIIVGTVLKEKGQTDDFAKMTLLTPSKVKLVQQTKTEYLEGLQKYAFRKNSFLNVRFEDIQVMQHEKIPEIYGVNCMQLWNSSTYSDKGYLFLMMDFRDAQEPIIHVRSWQPKAFEDGTYVGMYDFDVVSYGK